MSFLRSIFGKRAGRGYRGPLEQLTARTHPDVHFGANVSLRVVAIERDGDVRVLVARALADGRPVGVRIAVPARIAPSVPLVVTFTSLGDESDALLRALSRLWSVATDAPFAAETRVSALSLSEHPFDADGTGAVRLKLFFEPEPEVEGLEDPPPGSRAEAELYLDIDLGHWIVELAEKDEGYRDPVIAHLRASTA